jgi:hypothetical protein
MAVLSLFESSTSKASSAAARPASRRRAADLGRLPRERRLAFYLGACQLLGLDPAEQRLCFVRCNDGVLRLFDPQREPRTLVEAGSGAGPSARLERELAAGTAAVAAGGGIAYSIDLESGDLRVSEILRASRSSLPPVDAIRPMPRRAALRELAASRGARRAAPSR